MQVLAPGALSCRRVLAALASSIALMAFPAPSMAVAVVQRADTPDVGRTLVSNPEAALDQPGLHWRLVEEFRLGGVLGDGPDVFGDISDVDADRSGRIFVLDTGAREVRVFDDKGRFLRRMARSGAGPGELLYFPVAAGPDDGMHIVWHPPGLLWVGSWVQHLVLDSLGNEVARTPMRTVVGVTPRDQVIHADTHFAYHEVAKSDRPSSDDREFVDHTYVVRLPRAESAASADGDTIWIEARRVTVSPPEALSNGRDRLSVSRASATPQQVAWTVGNGNLWLAHRAVLRFHEVTFAGDTVRTVELGDPPPSPALEDVMNGAEFDPGIAALHVSREGWLWVTREGEADAPSIWDLFDNCGRYRGAVAAPDRLWAVHVGRDGSVLGVASDVLGVDYVLSLRLEGVNGAHVTRERCTP